MLMRIILNEGNGFTPPAASAVELAVAVELEQWAFLPACRTRHKTPSQPFSSLVGQNNNMSLSHTRLFLFEAPCLETW